MPTQWLSPFDSLYFVALDGFRRWMRCDNRHRNGHRRPQRYYLTPHPHPGYFDFCCWSRWCGPSLHWTLVVLAIVQALDLHPIGQPMHWMWGTIERNTISNSLLNCFVPPSLLLWFWFGSWNSLFSLHRQSIHIFRFLSSIFCFVISLTILFGLVSVSSYL